MCGLGVILRVYPPGTEPPDHPASIPDAWLRTLDHSILHRGPDGQGQFRDRARRADGCTVDVAMVHRRLAIIDPADGAQPMLLPPGPAPIGPDSKGRLAVVFNGCIYNHRDLRRELQSLGRHFHTDHSDTEVLLHAWAVWRTAMTARLDGMFAFSIWDGQTGELFSARDLAGEKPLYELAAPGFAAGCSAYAGLWRLKAQASAQVPEFRGDSPSPTGVAAWLRFGASSEPLDTRIAELRPATWSLHAGTARTMGQSVSPGPARRAGPALTTAQVDAMLATAVRSRLESDVPVGCFLSGGIDSALVAAYARQAAGSLDTFTVRMPDPAFDESDAARDIAAHLQTRHTTLDCDARPDEQLPMLIALAGLPLGDSSLLPVFWVSGAARQHVRVVLTGDGGDELFGGYQRHVAHRWLRQYRRWLGMIPPGISTGADARSSLTKIEKLARAGRDGDDELRAVIPKALLRQLVASADALTPPARHIDDLLLDDFDHYLPDDLLRKVDLGTMAVALESRAPMLARECAEAAMACPLVGLMPANERKGLLKRVALRHLPPSFVGRPKMGFAIPIGSWFRSNWGGLGTLMRDTLGSADPFPASLLGLEISPSGVQRLIQEHMEGRADHDQRLYLLLVLALWCRWARERPENS